MSTDNNAPAVGELPGGSRRDSVIPSSSSVSIDLPPVAGFSVDPAINSLVKLQDGPTLPWRTPDVQAVVNSTNRHFSAHEGTREDNIHLAAGPELAAACSELENLRIGEATVTPGFKLDASWVVHTVGPRWFAKYATAAETALSHCYRSSLGAAVEVGARSIVFGCVHTTPLAFPRLDAARVALRTVRRFLEKHGGKFDVVILCINDKGMFQAYEDLSPLYFPRNAEEEAASRRMSLADMGNEHGEPYEPERRVRVESGPASRAPASANSQQESANALDRELHDLFYERRATLEESDSDATTAFCARTPGPDERVVKEMRQNGGGSSPSTSDGLWAWLTGGGGTAAAAPAKPKPAPKPSSESRAADATLVAQYNARIARARSSNLDDIDAMEIMHADCGKDFVGRPLVLVVGAHAAPIGTDSRERFLDYAAREMERVANTEYAILYCHANAGSDTPFASLSFLRSFHAALSPDHRSRCCALWVLHATATLRATWNMMALFEPLLYGSRLRFVDSLNELYADLIPFGQLPIPRHVVWHDHERCVALGLEDMSVAHSHSQEATSLSKKKGDDAVTGVTESL